MTWSEVRDGMRLARGTPLAATVAVAVISVLGCASGDSEDGVSPPRSVLEVRAAFEAHGISLARIGDDGGVTLLGLPDSDQLVVGVYPTAEDALADTREAGQTDTKPEVRRGDNIIFTTRNVVVIFDSTGSDYSAQTVRGVMASLE